MQRLPGGDAGDRQRCGLGELGSHRADGVSQASGTATRWQYRPWRTTPRPPPRTSTGSAVDVPGGLGAGYPRQVGGRRADGALGDPHVERIDGCVGDVDEVLAVARLRIGNLVELQGAADGVKSSCAHRATVGRKFAAPPSG